MQTATIKKYKKKKTKKNKSLLVALKPAPNYVGEDIKRIRFKKGYTQSMLAKIMNVNEKSIYNWERKKRKISGVALRLLELIDKGIYTP